ncbi:choice-of-anchor A family protein [Dyadobacter sp. CY345]|uniref:choice-of-anchor A family protein n=1 Tax=Dyadobacter sp. CY345 TaxID=2909335 RepID=UPI001F3AD58C|nr:choice-of-anchor A family protein [Dyadobacter sp. CY345]MCF2447463.1 choice-of-anchor A family protein [Dyadobacter sp. CY345]
MKSCSKKIASFFSLAVISVFFLSSNVAFAQCNGNTVLTVPETYLSDALVGNGNFNAIIFGNLVATGGDSEGRLVVAGDFTAPGSYSVGSGGGRDATPNTDNFIVNGKFTNANNWGMTGNFVYNETGVNTQNPTHPAGTGTNKGPGITDLLAYNNLKTYFTDLSVSLSNLTSNGNVTYAPYSFVTIDLVGTSTSLNIFSVTLPEDKPFGININVPANSAVLINVTNKNVVVDGGSINGGQTEKTLFNFPVATNISLKSFALQGQLLAPLANLAGSGGNINGQAIIGGNVTQDNGFEFHNYCSTFAMPTVTPLPVTLTSFTVGKEGTQVVLNWETTLETNSDRFEIQRSVNAKDWSLAGTVTSTGESKNLVRYQFVDASPVNGQNYYRLKMIDRDATFALSRFQNVFMNVTPTVTIFPNPVVNDLTIETQDRKQVSGIYLINAAGQKVAMPISADKVDMSKVRAGIYVIQVNQSDGMVSTTKVVKQ